MNARALLLSVRAVAGFLCLFASSAWAQGPVVALTWQAPLECGRRENAEERVSKLVAHGPAVPLAARVSIAHVGAEYRADLETADGQRALAAPQCADLVEALVVVLALAIDPEAQTPAPAEPVTSAPAAVATAPEFSWGLSTTFDSATLPRVASGAEARATVSWPAFAAELHATYWLPENGTPPSQPFRGGAFTWWTLAPTGCLSRSRASSRLELCLAPELGRLTGRGFGVSAGQTRSSPWLALVLTPQVRLPLRPGIAFRAGAGAALALLGSRSFVLETANRLEEVHHPGRWSLRANLGLDVAF